MKYLSLLFCLILCSCERSSLDGDCVPITLEEFTFNSQKGVDSIVAYDSWWHFTGARKEECEVQPEMIECSWFSAVKKDSIVVASVKQNNTGQKRYGDVEIKGNGGRGECSETTGGFIIIQCPEPTDIEISKEELLFSAAGGADSIIVTTNRGSWLERPIMGIYVGMYYYGNGSDFSHIEDPWFDINIIDNKIIFSMSKNESEEERNFTVIFDPNNCGPSVKVIQSAE